MKIKQETANAETTQKTNSNTKYKRSLSYRAVSSALWVSALRISGRFLSFVRIVILARLLEPNDFGLFGIALLSISILQNISITGFGDALIQRKENTADYLNAAWTMQIIRGVFLCGILILLAPLFAFFFKNPQSKILIQVIGANFFIESLRNIGIISFRKELEFHKYSIYEFITNFTDLIVSTVAAFILRSAWALVIGYYARSIVRFIVSYLIHPYRPRLSFDWIKIGELFSFGKWILGNNILIFTLRHGADFFIGRVFGTISLGFYRLGSRLSNMIGSELAHIFSRVTFPVYSKIQTNLSKLAEAYLIVTQLNLTLLLPVTGLIWVLALDFTRLFLGEKWLMIVPIMKVLAILGLTMSLNNIIGALFKGIGRPKLFTIGYLVQLGLLIIIIYPFSARLDLVGVALALVVSNIFALGIMANKLQKVMKFEIARILRVLIAPTLATAAMVLTVIIVRAGEINNIFHFFVVAIIGLGIYGLILFLLGRKLNYEAYDFVIKTIRMRLPWRNMTDDI